MEAEGAAPLLERLKPVLGGAACRLIGRYLRALPCEEELAHRGAKLIDCGGGADVLTVLLFTHVVVEKFTSVSWLDDYRANTGETEHTLNGIQVPATWNRDLRHLAQAIVATPVPERGKRFVATRSTTASMGNADELLWGIGHYRWRTPISTINSQEEFRQLVLLPECKRYGIDVGGLAMRVSLITDLAMRDRAIQASRRHHHHHHRYTAPRLHYLRRKVRKALLASGLVKAEGEGSA